MNINNYQMLTFRHNEIMLKCTFDRLQGKDRNLRMNDGSTSNIPGFANYLMISVCDGNVFPFF